MPPTQITPPQAVWAATSPVLAAQPTVMGREVHRLTLFGGKLIPAGGDWVENTGPLPLESISTANPAAGFASEGFTAQTEALWRGRAVGADLVLPYVDPRNAGSGSYARLHAGAWSVGSIGPVDPVHAFDIAKTAEGLWLSGSGWAGAGAYGRVWRSQDDGTSWASDPTIEAQQMLRCYGIVALVDDLVMFGASDSSSPVWYRPSGGAWSIIDNAACSSGVTFTRNGTPLAVALEKGLPEGRSGLGAIRVYGRPASAAAVTQARTDLAGLQARDLAVSADGQTLYLLTGPDVYALPQNGPATRVLTLGSGASATAIACDAARLYFGNAASNVYALPLPA